MPIPSSGAISLDTIQTEFGGSNPISLSEYYAGGTYVPSGTSGTNGAVPSSGEISFSQFYGTTALSWTPDGGATFGTANSITVDVSYEPAVQTINCSTTATWSFTSTGSPGFTSSVANNATGTSIILTLNGDFGQLRERVINLNSTVGSTTKYWTVTLRADYT
jgi:hypothetical protein